MVKGCLNPYSNSIINGISNILMKKNKKRTKEELNILSKKIIDYYYNNPNNNSYDDIKSKFNVDKSRIRKVLDAELERRFINRLSRKPNKNTI